MHFMLLEILYFKYRLDKCSHMSPENKPDIRWIKYLS